jgi:threonine/homoserine/homoserine lactone efflux protein
VLIPRLDHRLGACSDILCRETHPNSDQPQQLAAGSPAISHRGAQPQGAAVVHRVPAQSTSTHTGVSLTAQLLLLGGLYIAVEAITATCWSAAGSRIGAFGIAARTRRRLDRASGIAFLGLAGALAATER